MANNKKSRVPNVDSLAVRFSEGTAEIVGRGFGGAVAHRGFVKKALENIVIGIKKLGIDPNSLDTFLEYLPTFAAIFLPASDTRRSTFEGFLRGLTVQLTSKKNEMPTDPQEQDKWFRRIAEEEWQKADKGADKPSDKPTVGPNVFQAIALCSDEARQEFYQMFERHPVEFNEVVRLSRGASITPEVLEKVILEYPDPERRWQMFRQFIEKPPTEKLADRHPLIKKAVARIEKIVSGDPAEVEKFRHETDGTVRRAQVEAQEWDLITKG